MVRLINNHTATKALCEYLKVLSLFFDWFHSQLLFNKTQNAFSTDTVAWCHGWCQKAGGGRTYRCQAWSPLRRQRWLPCSAERSFQPWSQPGEWQTTVLLHWRALINHCDDDVWLPSRSIQYLFAERTNFLLHQHQLGGQCHIHFLFNTTVKNRPTGLCIYFFSFK